MRYDIDNDYNFELIMHFNCHTFLFVILSQTFVDPASTPRASALLGVSSLVHAFCHDTNVRCEKLIEVQEVKLTVL